MKKCLIIGTGNALTYKEIFPLIKDNKLWLGYSKGIGGKFSFIVPDSYTGTYVSEENGIRIAQVNNACWFTNLPHKKRTEELDLFKTYDPNNYPKYDNYDAIECGKTADIPYDYRGVIGVPISFLDNYCPEQFEIVGGYNYTKDDDGNTWNAKINGKYVYKRILIKKKI